MKLIITTSREPSRRSRTFIKDLVTAIPHAVRVNRGKSTLKDLANLVIGWRAYGLLMVLERRGNPSALAFYEVTDNLLIRKVLIKVGSVKLCREIRDFQRPLGINLLVINPSAVPSGLPAEVCDALVVMMRPKVVTRPVRKGIEIVVSGSGDEAFISFLCASTNRPCGPMFRAFKVVRYEGGKAPS
ncbi:MAG: hypothetical protein DRO09_02785 [Thermoprotei archaeon]|nr:MAG: hypothetical protein DRO09_02785 [Thermoprotei archaeon]